MQEKSNLKGALYGLLAMAIYASHDAIVKGLGGKFSAIQIVFVAALLSFPILSFIMLNDKRAGHLRPAYPGWVILRSVCMIIAGLTAFYAFSTLPLAQVYPILFATPLLVTILSIPLLGETVRLRRWVAIAVGLAGVLIVVRPGQADLALGHLAAVLSAFCTALASVIVRKIGTQERSIVLLIYPMMGNFLAMGMALPFVYVPMDMTDFALMGTIALFGLTASFITILAYREGEAVIVAPMQYSQIIWAVVFGYLFFSEGIDLTTLVGAGVVIASGVYMVLREKSAGTSQNMPVLNTRHRLEMPYAPRSSLLGRLLKRPVTPGLGREMRVRETK
ncbi:DMT family transporter [Thioclava litoralis]|uniref:DMT family transporter n=1 Tax=Thioclava litoralis TaxID=3076557 RepID=A0ABZ1E4C7_9RHOB|nr:DMT family transporter [Thioclava sp. FTW29]